MIDSHIIVAAYNRPEHTAQVLDGLKENKAREFTVFIDKARNEEDSLAQKKIESSLSRIDWADVKVVWRSKSLGLAGSISSAITEVLESYNSIIVLEDDCVPEKGFIDYSRCLLKAYRHEKKVRSVCGYLYPEAPTPSGESHFFARRFCPWGWATWRDRWCDFSLDLATMVNKVQSFGGDLSALGEDVVGFCSESEFLSSRADIWSLSWILTHALDNSYVAYPNQSLIRNIGFDGSGVHSVETTAFDHNKSFDYPWMPEEIVAQAQTEPIKVNPELNSYILRFLELNSKMAMYLK